MIPKNQPDVKPESPTTELSRLARQLPMHVVGLLVVKTIEYNLSDGALVRGIARAVDFQSRGSWRCASCYRWQDKPNLVVACVPIDEEIAFGILCPRCEKRLQTTDRIMRAIESYMRAEVRP